MHAYPDPGSGSEALPVDDRRSMDSSDSGTVTNPFPLLVLLVIVASFYWWWWCVHVQPLSAASSATVGELQACSSMVAATSLLQQNSSRVFVPQLQEF